MGSTMSVAAPAPGTNGVGAFDPSGGAWGDRGNFSYTRVPGGPACSITGQDAICAGTHTTWCGPAGDFLYAWSGPNGFTGSTQCVEVSDGGDYSLVVTDRVTGAANDPCTMALTAVDCGPPPPP